MKLASPVLEDPSAESRFSHRPSSTKLWSSSMSFVEKNCPTRFPVLFCVIKTLYLSNSSHSFLNPILVATVMSLIRSACFKYGTSVRMLNVNWPLAQNTIFLVLCHNRRFVCELLKIQKKVVKTFLLNECMEKGTQSVNYFI